MIDNGILERIAVALEKIVLVLDTATGAKVVANGLKLMEIRPGSMGMETETWLKRLMREMITNISKRHRSVPEAASEEARKEAAQ